MRPLRLKRHGEYLRQHWRRLLVPGLGMLLVLVVVIQLVYPKDSLPLFTTIDGVHVGGFSKSAAAHLLDGKYEKLPINLYFGDNKTTYRQPKPDEIGLTIDSRPQVEAKAYPLWLKLVPTSLWWAHVVVGSAAPHYARDDSKAKSYVEKELGKSCDITPENASLVYKDNELQVTPAVDGGTCKLTDVTRSLQDITPSLKGTDVRFAMQQKPAKIHDAEAVDFANRLTDRTKNVSIRAGNTTVSVPQKDLLSWLDFKTPDTGLVATVNSKRAADFLARNIAPKVTVIAGTTRVTTVDFAETNRKEGASGQVLDDHGTIDMLNQWLSGKSVELVAKVDPTTPLVTYSRSYTATDTGLAALLAHFAQSHSGVFGVGYAELSGQRRHAGYNDSRVFETASTYKLFVAYGTLKRIQSGTWHWSDKNISKGRNLTKCFDDMIVLSDNECAKALLVKIGYAQLTHEIQAIGLSHSSFLNSYIQTTPGDLVKYLGLLGTGQLLNATSTNTLVSAMKRNVYRQGIPAGTGATVADKVGFLYALLHDASIVYSPKGTYVLVVMTDGSSWSTIADLTRQIEKWHNGN